MSTEYIKRFVDRCPYRQSCRIFLERLNTRACCIHHSGSHSTPFPTLTFALSSTFGCCCIRATGTIDMSLAAAFRPAGAFARRSPILCQTRSLVSSPSFHMQYASSVRAGQHQLLARNAWRRCYATEGPSVSLSPKPKKRAGFFRWSWRFTKLASVGGVAYLIYTIYDMRNPADQVEPDPSKKTLVVLGSSHGRCPHRTNVANNV